VLVRGRRPRTVPWRSGCPPRPGLCPRGELDVGIGDRGEAEHLGGVDEREQVVDLERQVLRELGQVVPAASLVEDLQQAGQFADAGAGSGRSVGDSRPGSTTVVW